MASKNIEFRVGVIILIGIVILAASLYWLQGYKLEQNAQVIRVMFDDVGTLSIGDRVTVSGVHRGKVDNLELVNGGVLVKILLYRDVVLHAITERSPMNDIQSHITAERTIAPPDWEETYNVYAGATFNLAHNIGQMLYFRPHNKFEEIDHCYLVGGGTHPGSGLPTIYESGRISAELLVKDAGASGL